MTNLLKPGKYVVAVSGGVDSIALLNMLSRDKNLELVIAHFDHGIRQDSAEDTAFVKGLANSLGLEFVSEREELGPKASEATARKHRYNFLSKVLNDTKSDAIVTAHHQDDLIETALLNVLRGTKHKGLVSLKSTVQVKRPLLSMPKSEIKKYATGNNLKWREDSTNLDLTYRRNQIRAIIKKTLNAETRQKLLAALKDVDRQSNVIDSLVNEYLTKQQDTHSLSRSEINSMELPEACEITAGWLRKNGVGFDKKTIERIVHDSKTLKNGSQIDIQKGYYCLLTRHQIILKQR